MLEASQKSFRFYRAAIIFLSILLVWSPTITHAQPYVSSVASSRVVLDSNSQVGDIVSFDKDASTFHLSRVTGDKNVFGIVAKTPVIFFSNAGGGVPVVTSGEVYVNVTTKNGPIKVGDYIASSAIPGKGVKANSSDLYIVGIAMSPFSGSTSNSSTTIHQGSIRMLFQNRANPLLSVVQRTQQNITIGKNIIFHIMKYILATLIAIGTVYIAFRASGSNMKSGLISIGRNPLAKTSIRSMLIINMVMIILISVIGLTAAVALVLLPV